MRFLNHIFLFVVLLPINIHAQDSISATQTNENTKRTFLSLGNRKSGVCFGNSNYYSGLRLNAWDRKVSEANGINLSGYSNCNRVNGLSIGLLVDSDSLFGGRDFNSLSIRNGISISGLLTAVHTINGIAIAGLGPSYHTLNGLTIGLFGTGGNNMNGVAIGGLIIDAEHINGIAFSMWQIFGKNINGAALALNTVTGDTLNGFFVGLMGLSSLNCTETYEINGVYMTMLEIHASQISGFALGAIVYTENKFTGVSVALINYTKELHGLQIGLLNIAKNNHGVLRYLPGINFHR